MKLSTLALSSLSLVVFGAIVFVWQVAGADSSRAWQIFLINVLFFSAIAQSGPVLAAVYELTEARWGERALPLAVGLGSFLPVSFLLFVVLLVAFPYFPKPAAEFPARQLWFNPPFLIGRDLLAIAILYAASLVFAHRILNRVQGSTSSGIPAKTRRETGELGATGETVLADNGKPLKFTGLAALVLGAYVLVFSLIGFDLVMGLDRQWYSTLFGGYFSVSSFYIGLAAAAVIVAIAKSYGDPSAAPQTGELWDLGKLLLGFCLLTAYLFWAQFLVTWYGNLPEEIEFFIRRLEDPEWAGLAWSAIVLTFGVPFFALLRRRAKQSPMILSMIALTVLTGMWIERYVLVAPSLALRSETGPGWPDVMITLGFFAAMTFSYTVYLRFYPLRE